MDYAGRNKVITLVEQISFNALVDAVKSHFNLKNRDIRIERLDNKWKTYIEIDQLPPADSWLRVKIHEIEKVSAEDHYPTTSRNQSSEDGTLNNPLAEAVGAQDVQGLNSSSLDSEQTPRYSQKSIGGPVRSGNSVRSGYLTKLVYDVSGTGLFDL